MSLEMLFKGILAARTQKIPNTHMLLDLARQVGMVTEASTATYLKMLTHSIRWTGRYPVPNTMEEWLSEGDIKAEIAGSGTFAEQVGRTDAATGWTAFDQVWIELNDMLCREVPDWELRG